MKIAVIGDGGWGTANAMLLAGNGHDVTLWGAFPEYVEEMRRTRRNEKFLKGVVLPDSLKLTADRREAVDPHGEKSPDRQVRPIVRCT